MNLCLCCELVVAVRFLFFDKNRSFFSPLIFSLSQAGETQDSLVVHVCLNLDTSQHSHSGNALNPLPTISNNAIPQTCFSIWPIKAGVDLQKYSLLIHTWWEICARTFFYHGWCVCLHFLPLGT